MAFNADHEHLEVGDAEIPEAKARQRVVLKAPRMLSTVWGPVSSTVIRPATVEDHHRRQADDPVGAAVGPFGVSDHPPSRPETGLAIKHSVAAAELDLSEADLEQIDRITAGSVAMALGARTLR